MFVLHKIHDCLQTIPQVTNELYAILYVFMHLSFLDSKILPRLDPYCFF